MNYPYRECDCGAQIHVGGIYQCNECIEKSEKGLATIASGGPAFPRHGVYSAGSSYEHTVDHAGMSLRDWFAGMALQGLISASPDPTAPDGIHLAEDGFARRAYEFADAMLKARES